MNEVSKPGPVIEQPPKRMHMRYDSYFLYALYVVPFCVYSRQDTSNSERYCCLDCKKVDY